MKWILSIVVPENHLIFGSDSKSRIVSWLSNKLTVTFWRTVKKHSPTSKKPPWNAWYLSEAALKRFGWHWAPKVSPKVDSPPSTTQTQTLNEQPQKEIEVVPLREPFYVKARVQVFWGAYKKFFPGFLRQIDKSRVKSCLIQYDDGDVKWELQNDLVLIDPEFDVKDKFCSVCEKRCQLQKCTKCKVVLYCSRSCQKSDWPKHKKLCNPSS